MESLENHMFDNKTKTTPSLVPGSQYPVHLVYFFQEECDFCKFTGNILTNLRDHLRRMHKLSIFAHKINLASNRIKITNEFLTEQNEIFKGHKKVKRTKGQSAEKKMSLNLNNLPREEFLKELMKRYEEYLRVPDFRKIDSAELFTAHPQFPSASCQDGTNKWLSNRRAEANVEASRTSPKTYTVGQWLEKTNTEDTPQPSVLVENVAYCAENVQTPQKSKVDSTSLKLIKMDPSENVGEVDRTVMINSNGNISIVRLNDFYATMIEAGEETGQTLEMITNLLESGEEIEIREEENIEIQNM